MIFPDRYLPVLLVAVVGLLMVGLIVFAWRRDRQRTAALTALAGSLGLSFDPATDRDLAWRYEHFRGMHDGENRYASKVFRGTYKEHPVIAFDFHYETSSTDSKGNRSTSHHKNHVVLLGLERAFPNLLITPEGVFSKLAQAIGYEDIDFESHEFSRRYCVRSPDRKFAYDFCNALMIELLLAEESASVELAGETLAFVRRGTVATSEIEPRLAFAVAVRARLPDYLFVA